MGTGGSKFHKSKRQKVVAEILVPGSSVPIKVKGEVNLPAGDEVTSHHSGAKVREVGPNKFSIELANQHVVTFNTEGDFHAYLMNAAQLTVTNIETVPDDDDEYPTMLSTSYSFNLTPSNLDNYSDDEDWEDIIDNIEGQSSCDEVDGSDINEAKQRKSELKKALQAKRANLSPQEYQQMISNHKQEMELMEMLRQKEIDRQKNSLASKVADRKKKRLARKQEATQKELNTQIESTDVLVEKPLEKQNIEIKQSEMEILKLHVLSQTNCELEAEINQRNQDFEEHMQNMRAFISEKEYRKLLLQHKAQVCALSRKLEIGKDNQRIHLMEKLAQRSKRKSDTEEKALSSEEVKELQLALNTKDVDFRKQLTRTKSTLTSQESEQMIKEHKDEMKKYQHQLEKERISMQEGLMARLALRINNDKTEEGSIFSCEDLKQLQLVVDGMSQTANNKMKQLKDELSTDDYNKLMTKERNEKEELQRQIDIEKVKTNEWQKRKIAAMSFKLKSTNSMIQWDHVITETTNQDIQQLEAELKNCKKSWENDKNNKKSILSKEEYETLMKEYEEEVDRLEKRLSRQRDAQRQHLLDKLAERRARKDKNAMAMTADEVKEMQLAIAGKDVSFKAEIKVIKGQQSSEEFKRLIEQHKEEMNNFQRQLDVEREKMREKLMEKVTARQRRGLSDEEESLTEEEIKQIQLALDYRNTIFKENIKETKSALTPEDYQHLLDNHLTEQQQLQDHLAMETEKMEASLKVKLKHRYARVKNLKHQESNTTDIQAQIDTARTKFEKIKKEDMTDEEYEQLLQEHDRQMKKLQGLLKLSLERQKLNMMDRLAARRKKKALLNAEEDEKQRLLLLLGKDTITLDEIEQVIDELEEYEVAAKEDLEEKREQVSEEEYKTLLASHQQDMDVFQVKLDEQKKRMGAKLAGRLAARSKIRTELQEAEDQMQEFSVLESSVEEISIAVKTQLWTTPVQSKALVVVPLPEEYPVRKKRQLYTDASIFRDIDSHAIKLAQTGSLVTYPTFSALVDELMRIGTTELEKARLAFRWITAQNCDEMDLSEVVDDTPLGVLKGIYFHKITFSTLFMRMCRFIGLRCVEINGCARVKGYKPGTFISLENQEYLHTWNAVRIDGRWHFVDCNWGVSHIAGSVTFDPFRFEYDEHYFLADPEVIIATHYPNEASWQLVTQPLTLQQFNGGVVLKPDFFKFGFQLNIQQAVVHLATGDLDLRIGHPPGFVLSCKVTSSDNDRNTTSNGVSFDQFVFVHQVAENQMSIYVRFPEVGKFFVVVYAKKQYVDGEVNIETETEICRYHVICNAPSADQYPLPCSPANHWGPIGVGNAGLVPVTHRTAVIVSNGEPVTIRFKFSLHLFIHHELTCQERALQQLHVMHRKFNGNVLFTVTPPHASRFGLNIYITYPNDPQQQKVHLCSYLVVVNKVEGAVLPIPVIGENWGETRAFTNLGLTAASHPDPLITVPCENNLRVNIGIGQPVVLQHRLHYHSASGVTDLTSTMFGQSSRGSIAFLLHLPDSGYYVFKILGSDSNETEIPLSLCFVYLIKRC